MPTDVTNRCRVLTGVGASALAVVRLSGPGIEAFLARWFSRPVERMRPTHGQLRDRRGVIDDPVIVVSEDGLVADLTLHGSPWIVACVKALTVTEGFAVDEIAAARTIEEEVSASLHLVGTELAGRALLAQPAAWAGLPAGESGCRAMLADLSLEHLLQPPTVAIVGLPNAGKSTLANLLFGTRRSLVSPVAGTTRDWVGERADLDGLIVTLIDTPGLRETNDAIERKALLLSRKPIEEADLVLLVLDGTRDDAMQATLVGQYPAAMRVLNKCDAALATWTPSRIASIAATPISARDDRGIDALVAGIHERFGIGRRPVDAPRIWTVRQREEVEAMLGSLTTPGILPREHDATEMET